MSSKISDCSRSETAFSESNVVDAACQTEPVYGLLCTSWLHMSDHGNTSLNSDQIPFLSFQDLQTFWRSLEDSDKPRRKPAINLPSYAWDPLLVTASDPLSQAIIDFRDGARHAIQSGANVDYILGTSTPSLDTFFNQQGATVAVHSTWSWACQFAQAFPGLSLTLQLGTIYIAGLQVRFYMFPCKETFEDLPPILRPVRKQYTVPHPAGLDICHVPALKNFLFTHWDDHNSLLIKLVSSQDCNWPYSDAACFSPEKGPNGAPTMSLVFIEHIRNLNNYTLGPSKLELIPQLAGD
ncbi:hypothetical protein LTR05_008603 [Lithohypha guttulata]|uniref:Uncharacterized protein n=1 Tax=Lithohypha guttulata TaxID=1690604 RepID=A0AAN7Q7B4_9EURO|nr:hypothetical protein LTR05_008603 [Lithohypha guttulata]